MGRRHPSRFIFFFVAAFCLASPVRAQYRNWNDLEVALRFGTGLGSSETGYRLAQIAIDTPLPLSTALGSAWMAGAHLQASLGQIRTDHDRTVLFTLGPALRFDRRRSVGPFVEIGTAIALLSGDRIGGVDIGGKVHFTSHIELGWRWSEYLSMGYRLQHISNAGISEPNPGLDTQALALRYDFR